MLGFGVQETIEDALDGPSEAIVLGTLRRDEGGAERFALSLAEAHATGVGSTGRRSSPARRQARSPLPTYPFQRQRYWLDAAAPAPTPRAIGQADAEHPLLGAAIDDRRRRGPDC